MTLTNYLQGHLNDLTSWNQSHVLFRNKGSIQAGLHMEAQATVRFSTGSVELFGMQNFGGTFTVPGIVTIGPNFRVLGVCGPSSGFRPLAKRIC